MTADKKSFSERREALAAAAETLRALSAVIDLEVVAMRDAEARFANRTKTNRRSAPRHG